MKLGESRTNLSTGGGKKSQTLCETGIHTHLFIASKRIPQLTDYTAV